MSTLNTRIVNKHDIETNWITASNAKNPFIPLQGEIIIYEADSKHSRPRFKVGDGQTVVGELPFTDLTSEEIVEILDNYLIDIYTRDLEYVLKDGSYYTCKGFKSTVDKSTITTIVIPEKYKGLPVSAISNSAFADYPALKSVILPDTLTKIGKNVFKNCNNLVNLYIPKSVLAIGEGAFEGCSSLLEYIDNIGYVGNWAVKFKSDTTLNELNFRDGTLGIIDKFSYGDTSITSITIPESVLYVGSAAFSECSSVKNLNIYSKDITIQEDAFVPMQIENANIPASMIPGIEKDVLKTLVINAGDTIPASAFKGCGELTDVTFPETLRFIGKEAFGDCFKILNVYLPNIEMWCNVEFEDGFSNPVYYIQADGNIYFNGEVLINLVIPRTIIELKNNIFYGYQKLKTVKFEENSMCSRIGDNAFGFCRALTSVEMPNSIIEIGSQAFIECIGLTTITIPDGVETIGYSAFKNCNNINSVIMGKSIQRIYEQAFSGCTAIQNFYLTDIRAWAIVDLGDAYSSPLYYANGDLYYITAGGDIDKIETLIIPNSVNKIKQYTFQGSLTLKEIVIPESVDTIEYSAFCYDRNITTVYLPLSLKTIETTAFEYCTGITIVYYAGTESQWNSIVIESNNNNLVNATRKYGTIYEELTIPTKVSELENDANYAKKSELPTKLSQLTNDANYAKKSEIPTKISAFSNDAGYAKTSSIPTKLSQLTNDSGYAKTSDIPTDISQLNNDANFTSKDYVDNAINVCITKEEATNQAIVILAQSQSYTEDKVTTLANTVYTKDDVDAAIEAAIIAACSWGEF